jgi:DNA excision repair protein ERCC-6
MATCSTGYITAVKWNDNAAVCVATNFDVVRENGVCGKATRWNREKKVRAEVEQPCVIKNYNRFMGGVDILDRDMSNYRPSIKVKKWWWPFFINALNMAVTAAWRIHIRVVPADSRLDHLAFRINIVTALLKTEDPAKIRPGPNTPSNVDVRFDGYNHYIKEIPTGNKRCKLCKKTTSVGCTKCAVGLHKKCSEAWHTK